MSKKIIVIGGALASYLFDNKQMNYKIIPIDSISAKDDQETRLKIHLNLDNYNIDSIIICLDDNHRISALNEYHNTVLSSLICGYAASKNIKVISFSSVDVFSGEKEESYIESDTVSPVSQLGVIKSNHEKIVLNYPKAMILRLPWVFSVNDTEGFVYDFINEAMRSEAISVLSDQSGVFLNIFDLKQKISMIINDIIEYNRSGIMHISSNYYQSRFQIAKQIHKMLESKFPDIVALKEVREIKVEDLGDQSYYYMKNCKLDASKFNNIFVNSSFNRWTFSLYNATQKMTKKMIHQ